MSTEKAMYCNYSEIVSGIYDFILDFSMISPGEDEEIVYHDSIRVIMSPQHVKAFFKILKEEITEFEEKYGEIKLPPPRKNSTISQD